MAGRHLLRGMVVCGWLLFVLIVSRSAQAAPTLLGWHFETIGSGGYADLAIDATRTAHVAFYDNDTHSLKYAVREATGWRTETADGGNYVGLDPKLEIDQNGYAHISHTSGAVHRLYYTYEDEAGWHSETVSDGVPFQGAPLIIDSAGHVHLIYQLDNATNNTIRHAVRDGSGWQSETVYTCVRETFAGCSNVDAALDGADRIHIAFSLQGGGMTRLMVAAQDDGGWLVEPVTDPPDMGGSGLEQLALGVDGGGQPHISFSTISSLRYTFRDATGWHSEVIAGYYRGLWNDLAVSEAGTPHIAYYDAQAMTLRYAYRSTSGWHNLLLDGSHWVGHFPSIALMDGYPALTYQDPSDGAPTMLRYAFLTALDILPGQFPNVLDLSTNAKITVLVLGTAELDVHTIDPTTATFGPGGAPSIPARVYYKDWDQDGDTDLRLIFRTAASDIRCGDTTAMVQAQMYDGQVFRGWDEIVTVEDGENCN